MKEPIRPLTDEVAHHLRTAKGKGLAITGPQLATLTQEGGHTGCNARRIREIIAENYQAICQGAGGIIVAEAPAGYWIAGSDEELKDREALLWALQSAAFAKRLQFINQVKAAGLGAIMPKREEVA